MKAHELIADPKNWTQVWLAKDADEIHVDPDDPNAVCWCAVGALRKCYGNDVGKLVRKANSIINHSITHWNDDPARTHAEVIALLKQVEG